MSGKKKKSEKRKHTSIDLTQKVKLIRAYESENVKQYELGDRFGIDKRTVSDIIRDKERLLATCCKISDFKKNNRQLLIISIKKFKHKSLFLFSGLSVIRTKCGSDARTGLRRFKCIIFNGEKQLKSFIFNICITCSL